MNKFPQYLTKIITDSSVLEGYYQLLGQPSEYIKLADFLGQARAEGVLNLTLKNIKKMDTNNHLIGIAQKAAYRLAAILQTHTLLSLDYDALSKSINTDQLLNQTEKIHEIYIGEFEYVINTSKQVAKNGWVVIKGMSVASSYDDPSDRDNWDVDLYIENFDVAMDIAQQMIATGSTLDDISLKQVGNTGYGWKLHIFTPNGVPVEFHIGSLQAYAGGILETELLERKKSVSIGNVTFPVPSIEDQLLYLLAHAYRDGFIKYKDINDAYLLITNPDFDQAYFQIGAEQSFLTPVLFELLNKVSQYYPHAQTSEFFKWIKRDIISSISGYLFGKNRTNSSSSFQLLSFPAHVLYLMSHHTKYGARRCIFDVGRRIIFGLEHKFFPEKDARRDKLPLWIVHLHETMFPHRAFKITTFDTAYFQLAHKTDWESSGLSWQYIRLKFGDSKFHTTTGSIEPIADRLFRYNIRDQGHPYLILTPLGVMSSLTYYKTNLYDRSLTELSARELWSSIMNTQSEMSE